MSYKDQLIEFLAKDSNNLRTALEIERNMPDVRRYLAVSFWKAAYSKLEEALKASRLSETWEVRYTLADLEENPEEPEAGIQAECQSPSSGQGLKIGAWNEDRHVYFGVGFRKQYDWSNKPSQLDDLLGALKKEVPSFTDGALSGSQDDQWLAWGWSQIRFDSSSDSDGALMRISANPVDAADEAIGPLRDVLRLNDLTEKLKAADRAIASQ